MANRWKGFVLGTTGGIAGVLAMSAYWQIVTSATGQDPRKAQKQNETPEDLRWLDDISLLGKNHKDGESSTAALGRLAYRAVTGQEPESEETRTVLSYLVHWIISMGASGLYGALRGQQHGIDSRGGMRLAVLLWLLGDELLMPLTGFTDGPTAYPANLHAHGWGAHAAYGLASAAATQLLMDVF
jgi:hypothetical protein